MLPFFFRKSETTDVGLHQNGDSGPFRIEMERRGKDAKRQSRYRCRTHHDFAERCRYVFPIGTPGFAFGDNVTPPCPYREARPRDPDFNLPKTAIRVRVSGIVAEQVVAAVVTGNTGESFSQVIRLDDGEAPRLGGKSTKTITTSPRFFSKRPNVRISIAQEVSNLPI